MYFQNAKKGEEDPLISLRTRKARVVGKWKIKSGTVKHAGDFYYATTGQPIKKYTIIYSENSYESMTESPNYFNFLTGSLSYEVEFKKDGGYVATSVYNNMSTDVSKGTWNFTGKVGGHKNKEQILIHLTFQSYSYTGPSSANSNSTAFEGNKNDVTYYIKELRNKKMVLDSEDSATDPSGNATTYNSSLTFIQ